MSTDKGKKQLPLETIEKRDLFGWSVLVEPHTFTVASWTMEPSEFLVFNGDTLGDLFKKNNHIGYLIMSRITSVISSRLRKLSQKFINNL